MPRLLALIVVSSLVIPAFAQEKPKQIGELPGGLFFTNKGMPFPLERVCPGITAALRLTDDQKSALADAQQQTMMSPAVREVAQKAKGDGATGADRAAAQKASADARASLKAAVDKVLTDDQKALIARIQAAFEESQKAAMEGLEAEFGGAKGNPDRQAELRKRMEQDLRVELATRLDKILDAAQKALVDRAGTIQRDREEDVAKFGKRKPDASGAAKGGI
ncbi:MAG TPA: hypothetical protein VEA69_02115 [Tepidisphaeraceae bacterium]|nr:hypothetical protein [Tepidisphaeraceae bacterium]